MVSKKDSSQEEYEAVERATKAVVDQVATYYSGTKKSDGDYRLDPDYNLTRVLDLVRNDSIVWSGVTTLLDRVLESGWEIIDTDTGERLKANERLLKNKDFDFWLREMMLHYIIFQNAIGELVYTPNSRSVKELHTINPATIHVDATQHGEPVEYIQEVAGVTTTWKPEEIIHVADPSITLSEWGEVSIKTIWQAVLIRYHVKKIIGWLFETNQFRGIHNPKDADPEQIKRSITFLKESEKDIHKPIIFQGEYDYKVMREFKDLNVLNEVMYKMDAEILNYLQVPPIFAGLPDNSNRSNSESQERALSTRVRSIHKLFEKHMSELLKRMGVFKAEFKFKNVSIKAEKEVFENVQLMKSIGMSNEAIQEYMNDRNIVFNTRELFNPEPEMGGEESDDILTQDQAPSRKGKGEGEMNEQIGTGSDGTTREEQLVGRSYNFDYLIEDIE